MRALHVHILVSYHLFLYRLLSKLAICPAFFDCVPRPGLCGRRRRSEDDAVVQAGAVAT